MLEISSQRCSMVVKSVFETVEEFINCYPFPSFILYQRTITIYSSISWWWPSACHLWLFVCHSYIRTVPRIRLVSVCRLIILSGFGEKMDSSCLLNSTVVASTDNTRGSWISYPGAGPGVPGRVEGLHRRLYEKARSGKDQPSYVPHQNYSTEQHLRHH